MQEIPTQEVPKTVLPTPREEDWAQEMHARFVRQAGGGRYEVVFLGDSITDGWTGEGRAAWESDFAPLGAAAFGVGGDGTQHLLWRLEHGALGNLDPKAFVLLIGTNNAWAATPGEIVAGVRAIVAHLQAARPRAGILLLGLLPRQDSPNWQDVMGPIEEINRALAGMADETADGTAGGHALRFLDAGCLFWQPYGHIPDALMPDGIHLSPLGYDRLAGAILGPLRALLAEPKKNS